MGCSASVTRKLLPSCTEFFLGMERCWLTHVSFLLCLKVFCFSVWVDNAFWGTLITTFFSIVPLANVSIYVDFGILSHLSTDFFDLFSVELSMWDVRKSINWCLTVVIANWVSIILMPTPIHTLFIRESISYLDTSSDSLSMALCYFIILTIMNKPVWIHQA